MKKGTIGSGKLGYRGTPTSVEAVLKPGAGTSEPVVLTTPSQSLRGPPPTQPAQPNKPLPLTPTDLDGSWTAESKGRVDREVFTDVTAVRLRNPV